MKDWKKLAAENLKKNKDVEMAFMNQAITSIENKAAPFFTKEYLLGFEIVDKNDSNTKMVGIFAFRVNSHLIYAPVFFLNGEIKGTELMYIHDDETFCRLDPEWSNFYISKYEESTPGKLVDKSKSRNNPKDVEIRDIAFPPFFNKRANFVNRFSKEAAEKAWGLMQDKALEEVDNSDKLLPTFIKESGYKAFEVISKELENNVKFANQMLNVYDFDELTPNEIFNKEEQAVKSASEEEKENIKIHTGRFNPNTKLAFDEQIKRGYSIEDNRDESKLNVVYKSLDESFEKIENSCVAQVLTNDLSLKEVNVLIGKKVSFNDNELVASGSVPGVPYESDPLKCVVIDKNSDKIVNSLYDSHSSTKVYGKLISDLQSDELKTGNDYIVFDPNKEEFSEPIRVTNIKTKDGSKYISYFNYYSDETRNNTIVYNPDRETTSIKDSVLGKDIIFIKVDRKRRDIDKNDSYYSVEVQHADYKLGDDESLTEYLNLGGSDSNLKKASIEYEDNMFVVKFAGKNSKRYNEIGATAYLMTQLNISADDSEYLVKEAKENRKNDFVVKYAYSATIDFDDEPDFYEGYDSTLNVAYQTPETHVLEGRSSGYDVAGSRIGDKYQMEGLNFLHNASADELFAISQKSGDDTIFDHGIVGSLAKTYDATDFVNKYLKDLRQGLDKIGRIIFLFYWKPEDFIEMLGSDDQSEFENLLNNSFKIYSDLVLELVKKTDNLEID